MYVEIQYKRIYLIAGKALEPFTTITEKSRYEGLTTKGLAVRAAKYPNVFRRPYGTWVEGKRKYKFCLNVKKR